MVPTPEENTPKMSRPIIVTVTRNCSSGEDQVLYHAVELPYNSMIDAPMFEARVDTDGVIRFWIRDAPHNGPVLSKDGYTIKLEPMKVS